MTKPWEKWTRKQRLWFAALGMTAAVIELVLLYVDKDVVGWLSTAALGVLCAVGTYVMYAASAAADNCAEQEKP